MRKRSSKRPTIGLALSGGSVRGLSYIGFLKVIERENIPIDFIAGTSIGSVIGALYCSGMHPDEMERTVSELDWENFMDFTSEFTGLLDGNKIERYLRHKLDSKKFEKMYIPFATVAVDVNTGEQVVFEKGDVAQAVRASISIPGVFTPIKIGERLLVDGGVLDPIPIDVLQDRVDKVIAVDLTIDFDDFVRAKSVDSSSLTWKRFKERFIIQELKNIKVYLKSRRIVPRFLIRMLNPKYFIKLLQGKSIDVPPMFQVAMKANHISSNEMIRLKLEKFKPDLLIRPDIKEARFIEFDKAEYLIRKGEEAAEKHLKDIKRLAGIR